MEIWSIWYPVYWLSGSIKAITAGASITTAILLIRLIPKLLAIPSPKRLHEANRALENEIVYRRAAQEKLRYQEEQYRLLFETNPSPMWVFDVDTLRFLAVNQAAVSNYGYSREEFLSMTIENIRPPEDVPKLMEALKGTKESLDYGGRWRHVRKDGTVIIVEKHSRPVVFQNRPARMVTAIYVTERDEAERRVRESEEGLSLAQEMAHIGSWEVKLANRVPREDVHPRWSNETFRIFGFKPGEFEVTRRSFLDLLHTDERQASKDAFVKLLRHGAPYNMDHRVVLSDGTERIVHVDGGLIRNRKGEPVKLAGTLQDITERTQAQKRIIDSLREKEVLLKEIHHRVKNNLAVITSLFYLQSTYTQDEQTLRILQECQDRVRSMALVHETLYRSENFAGLDFAEYARALSHQLFRTYGAEAGDIHLRLNLQEVSMSIDTAVPCGLILSELVSNALKHAFPDGEGGEVTIGLCKLASGLCLLQVADDGAGFDADVETLSAGSLGLRLIQALTRQLDGEFELVNKSPGTEARLVFSVSNGRT
ncbi:MAG TPA: PAS domain S-box protein [Chthoniobacterales bacterium]